MHLKGFQARRIFGALVIVAGLLVGFFGYMALAQTPAGRDPSAEDLIGVTVFSAEGTPVGAVSAVSVGADGQLSEIRLTTASPLGLGERTVAIRQESFIVLDGAVVIDLSAAEVDALPTQTVLRGSPA
jgi:PRC-barrel domain